MPQKASAPAGLDPWARRTDGQAAALRACQAEELRHAQPRDALCSGQAGHLCQSSHAGLCRKELPAAAEKNLAAPYQQVCRPFPRLLSGCLRPADRSRSCVGAEPGRLSCHRSQGIRLLRPAHGRQRILGRRPRQCQKEYRGTAALAQGRHPGHHRLPQLRVDVLFRPAGILSRPDDRWRLHDSAGCSGFPPGLRGKGRTEAARKNCGQLCGSFRAHLPCSLSFARSGQRPAGSRSAPRSAWHACQQCRCRLLRYLGQLWLQEGKVSHRHASGLRPF